MTSKIKNLPCDWLVFKGGLPIHTLSVDFSKMFVRKNLVHFNQLQPLEKKKISLIRFNGFKESGFTFIHYDILIMYYLIYEFQ